MGGELASRFFAWLGNEIQGGLYGVPMAVGVGITAAVLGSPLWAAFVASAFGYALGRQMYYILVESNRDGFGPRRYSKELNASIQPGHFAKSTRKERTRRHFTLGEKPATRRQLRRVIDRIAHLKNTKQMKAITGNPDYEIEEGTGGHCKVIDGKIYIVLEDKGRVWVKGRYEMENGERVWKKGYYRKLPKGRDAHSLAHELGHAMELYAFGSTGTLVRFHNSHTNIMNDMVRAILHGKSNSWFHNNSPVPLVEPEAPDADAPAKAHKKYEKELAEYKSKKFLQEHWNYAELFAEFTELYLMRPLWVKTHYAEAAQFYLNYVRNTPIMRHLVLK